MDNGSSRRWIITALLGVSLLMPACVERSIEIRTEPPGAELWLDGKALGNSPQSLEFEHYGTHVLVARLREHRSDRREVEISPPVWEWFPFDFLVENLLPFRVVDRHEVLVQLEPSSGEPELDQEDALLRRAEALGGQWEEESVGGD